MTTVRWGNTKARFWRNHLNLNISSEASVIFHNVNEIFHLFGKLCSRYIRPFKYVNTAPQHITQYAEFYILTFARNKYRQLPLFLYSILNQNRLFQGENFRPCLICRKDPYSMEIKDVSAEGFNLFSCQIDLLWAHCWYKCLS